MSELLPTNRHRAVSRAVTHAYHGSKPTRDATRLKILDVIRDNADLIAENTVMDLRTMKCEIAFDDLVKILAHFNPQKQRTPRTFWGFIDQAVNPQEIRNELRRAYTVPEIGLCGSNGHVFFWVDTPEAMQLPMDQYWNPDGTICEGYKDSHTFPFKDYKGEIKGIITGETQPQSLGIFDLDEAELTTGGRGTNVILHGSQYNLTYIQQGLAGNNSAPAFQTEGILLLRPKPGWNALIMPIWL